MSICLRWLRPLHRTSFFLSALCVKIMNAGQVQAHTLTHIDMFAFILVNRDTYGSVFFFFFWVMDFLLGEWKDGG